MLALTADAKSPFLPKDDEEGEAADTKHKAEAADQKKPIDEGVDWTHLGTRIVPVPLPAGLYATVDSYAGHLLLTAQSSTSDSSGPAPSAMDVISYDLSTRTATTIITGVDAFEKSVDGK
jgi:hypothetical protein